MSKVEKTKAASLGSIGSTCAFIGLILGGPLLGIPAVILGILAFKAMTPEEKAVGMNDAPKNRALTAIIGGILVSALWIWFVISKM